MSRLIDADEAYKVLTDYYNHRTEIQHEVLKAALSKVPTVDAEPIKCGHWIGENQTKFEKLLLSQRVFKCSVCGNYLDFDGINAGRGSANFCPNCGANMDEVTDDI